MTEGVCRVHLLRDILTHVPRHAAAMVAAFVRTIFTQPDEAAARAQLQAVAERLATIFRTKIWSTSPLEWAQPRARPAQRGRRDLPQSRRPPAARDGAPRGAARRVAGDGQALLTQASMTRLIGAVPGTTLSELFKEGMAV